jgi:Glycosyl transferase family 2
LTTKQTMMNTDNKIICYKFASRSRPDKFFKALHNILTLARHPHYFILCSFDLDDESMNNFEVRNRLDQYDKSRLIYHFGTSKNKIDAINRDMEHAPHFDVLINMSDDMRFLVEGYDKIILRDMYTFFPNGDGCLAYWDQGKETKGTGLITLAIMDRVYYERTHYIYFPYQSLWCDNEMTKVAIKLRRYKFCDAEIISHDHPANGIGQTDAQYQRTEAPAVWASDKALFDKREKKGFYITDTILSILICTVPPRKEMLDSLLNDLQRQISLLPKEYGKKIEIIWNSDIEMVRGNKRNKLLDIATGKFVVFIDDDDHVSEDYVHSILEAIAMDPTVDCIGMDGWMTTNGQDYREWSISKTYGSWYEKDSVYYRTPNHISPIRRELADLHGFPDIDFAEDYKYSMDVLPYLKRETKINKKLYHYDYRSK